MVTLTAQNSMFENNMNREWGKTKGGVEVAKLCDLYV
jgi:hypothetical protein